jgi:arylsulfatase A-like enzyme
MHEESDNAEGHACGMPALQDRPSLLASWVNKMMNRRQFLRNAGCLAAAAATSNFAAGVSGDSERKQPNVLFMFSDDQRFNTIHALGNPVVKTPAMDSLVHSGVAFTHAHIMGGNQGAVCVPSRAMVLTGRYLFRADPIDARHNQDVTLWPEAFRQAGYTTFGTGKWHNGPWAYAKCFMQGGNIFFGGMSDHLQVPVHDFDPTGQYPDDKKHTGEKFSSELFSDTAIQFLKGYKDEKPFFLYVAYTAPHDPRMAPKEFAEMYPPDKIEVPKNFLPQHPFDNGELKVRDELLAGFPRTPKEIREHIAAYYAMITHLDRQMGRVLDALKNSGHGDDTIIIFGGDNGLALGQHGLMGKQNLYDHSIRVPLIFSGPGIARGKKKDALVYLSDIFPTTCELTGLVIPTTVETKSLVPLLQGKTEKVRDSIFAAYRDFQRAVRTDRYKLIRYPYVKKTQLFDIQNDPLETKDLSGDPRNADLVKQLNALLRQWQKETGDPLDLENPPARQGKAPETDLAG